MTVISCRRSPLMSIRTIICARTQTEIMDQNGVWVVIWRVEFVVVNLNYMGKFIVKCGSDVLLPFARFSDEVNFIG